MALPVLNDKPIYEVKVPSMDKKVKFRPYLVKEEKVLLLAMETQDPQQILQAISDTVLACITDELDPRKMTTFDIEFLFLKIRSKSVGERAPLIFKCKECEHPNEVVLNIDDIDIECNPKESKKKVQLNSDITLVMRWPTYSDMIADSSMLANNNTTQMAFGMVSKCIEAIQTEEENFLIKDQPKEDVMAFLESLTAEQYKVITNYIESMPQLVHTVSYNCESCGTENNHTLKGIQDFF